MRCLACNELLTDKETTRKSSETGEYIDLCNICISGTGIAYIETMYEDDIEDLDSSKDN